MRVLPESKDGYKLKIFCCLDTYDVLREFKT